MKPARLLTGAALLAALGAGCDADPAKLELSLTSNDCAGNSAFDLREDATDLEVVISGDGMSVITEKVLTEAGTLEIPSIPVGKNRVVTVKAWNATELVATGRSASFEVTADSNDPVVVVLRAINRFAPTATAANGCTVMTQPRAGHSIALLPDGRVLIAGGFRELDANGNGVGYLATAEIFDPGTGTFTPAGDMCGGNDFCLPRAHAPAVSLDNGDVILVGGESQANEGDPRISVGSAAIYDPGLDSWSLTTAMTDARRFHTVTALERDGHLVVAGGLDSQGNVLTSVEFFDPRSGDFRAAPDADLAAVGNGQLHAGRAFHAALPVGNQAVALLGGIDVEFGPTRFVNFVQRAGDSYKLAPNTLELPAGVAAGVASRADDLFVIAGGAQRFNESGFPFSAAFGSALYTKLPTPDANQPGQATLKFPRVAPCVVQIDDGRALLLGGFGDDGTPLDKAELLSFEDGRVDANFAGGRSSGTSKMTAARAYGACLRLPNDTVLVTGGVGSDRKASDSAELYLIKQLDN